MAFRRCCLLVTMFPVSELEGASPLVTSSIVPLFPGLGELVEVLQLLGTLHRCLLASRSEGNCSGSAGVRVRLRRLDYESGIMVSQYVLDSESIEVRWNLRA